MDNLSPSPLLEHFYEQVPKGAVLDIGFGKGNDSVFLANKGFRVTAIDTKKSSVDDLARVVKENNLSIKTELKDIRKFEFLNKKYDIIVAIQSLIWMRKSEYVKIIKKIKESLKINGIGIISGFTIKDPSYLNLKSARSSIEKNTFYSKSEKRFWQFLEPQELKKCFKKDFKILHYREKLVKDRFYDKISPPHVHAIAEIVVKKKRNK